MPIKYIYDLSSNELLPYKGLKKHNCSRAFFIAETHTVIENAIEAGCIPSSFLVAEKYLKGRDKTLLEKFPDTIIYTSSDEVLAELTGYSLTRGILCAMTRPVMPDMNQLINKANRLAVLVNVQDPTNIGAIVRSACCLGIDAILFDSSCCDPLHRKSIRTSMGSIFKIPWVQAETSGEELAHCLRQKGIKTLALALDPSAVALNAIDTNTPVAVFFGSEGDGLDSRTKESCDNTVIIPMSNKMDSLNVAAAAAIVFWELAKTY